MSLIDTYNRMVNESQEKTAQVNNVSEAETAELEVYEKYAQLADNALATEYGEGKYNEDDIVKLASLFIESDRAEMAEMEKVAELYEMGQVIGKGIRAELGLK